MRPTFSVVAAMTLALFMIGCATAPKSEGGKVDLSADVQSALSAMKAEDNPAFDAFLAKSHAIAVFPNVGKAAWGVGGAYGKGEVWEQGRLIGFSDMTQATIGLQAGGQSFTEVLVFETPGALERFKTNKYQPTAQATAVALRSGAAANAKYTDGVAIFTHIKGGLMAEAAIGGQRFRFKPVQ